MAPVANINALARARRATAATCIFVASAWSVFTGAVAGIGGTAWLVYLLWHGQWAAAVGFVLVGSMLLMAAVWLISLIGVAALTGMAWLLDRSVLDDGRDGLSVASD